MLKTWRGSSLTSLLHRFVGGNGRAPGYDVRLWPKNLRFAESTAKLIAHPPTENSFRGRRQVGGVQRPNVQMTNPKTQRFEAQKIGV